MFGGGGRGGGGGGGFRGGGGGGFGGGRGRGRGGGSSDFDLNRRGIQKNLMGAAATFLSDNMKSLFRPREEIPFLPPVKPSSSGEEPSKLEGIAALTGRLESGPPPPREHQPTPAQLKAARKAEKAAKHAEQIAATASTWNPVANPSATSDPYRTLFIGRLAYETTEKKLQREFEEFGPVTGVTIVRTKSGGDGESRGYGFVEFGTEEALKLAYRRADGRKIDGHKILVDVERGRTVPGWKPRRLGGGLGETRRAVPRKRRKKDDWLAPPVPNCVFITLESKRREAEAQQAAINAALASMAGAGSGGGYGSAGGGRYGSAAPGTAVPGRTGYSIAFDSEMMRLERAMHHARSAAEAAAAAEAGAGATDSAAGAGGDGGEVAMGEGAAGAGAGASALADGASAGGSAGADGSAAGPAAAGATMAVDGPAAGSSATTASDDAAGGSGAPASEAAAAAAPAVTAAAAAAVDLPSNGHADERRARSRSRSRSRERTRPAGEGADADAHYHRAATAREDR